MLWRKPAKDVAKVGVEGSNPFARSKLFQRLRPRLSEGGDGGGPARLGDGFALVAPHTLG